MPGYRGAGQAALLRYNQQRFLFQQESGLTGRASIAVQLERVRGSHYPWGASFQLYFTDASGKPADPGAFEVDIQTSDTDADAQFCTISAVTGPLNASYAARLELPNFFAKFIRAYVKTLTNAVYVSVMATR
jgi:hypothetical protein